ncbi:unnamed protein product [Cuscuta epithymum]|uniref:Uncharacterized protein n=1 Tax=Cuscuta epithymum TaxID=186058 RepID=A0AAV0DDQ0_9ASTE|nr:unnamed protein product [Cuscuta epithymum]CAH9122277.1 unnamed protein product [Cuscuta epithymum]
MNQQIDGDDWYLMRRNIGKRGGKRSVKTIGALLAGNWPEKMTGARTTFLAFPKVGQGRRPAFGSIGRPGDCKIKNERKKGTEEKNGKKRKKRMGESAGEEKGMGKIERNKERE